MPTVFTSKNQKIGETGESLATLYLKKKGFSIIERNYTKKLGEIDIIATCQKKLYFFEVKTVTHVTSGIRPEDNVHTKKLERIYRTAQVYILEHGVTMSWQIDLLTVILDSRDSTARVERIENI